tara:strand:+ start:2376 stop:2549 length:174 start_codon:yes stop_codon:yes gene_type:complete
MKIKPYSIFFTVIAFIFFLQSYEYPVGQLNNIKHGFFPIVFSFIILILAIASCFIKK